MTYLDAVAMDIREATPSDKLPDESSTGLFLNYAVLLLAKGEAVTKEDVHNAWVAWMASEGREHESMVPFIALPQEVQDEDSPFVTAIRTVARSRNAEGTQDR
jgi:hypothetical protein